MTRGRSQYYVGALRLALDQHQRPSAMLLRDPYALHRDFYTGEPDGPLDEWTPWDFALAVVIQDIKDGTTEEGHLIWEIEDDRIQVEAIPEVNKARAAIDSVTNKENYKPADGEWWRTRLIHPWHDAEVQQGFAEGEFEFQTRSEWIEQMMEDESPVE